MADDNDDQASTPAPEDDTDGTSNAGPPTWFTALLADLFADRRLFPPNLDHAHPEAYAARAAPQAPNSSIFTAQLLPYTSPVSGMAAEQMVLCTADTVGLKTDKFMIGVVDRTFGDIDSHEPRPQRDYSEDIERHRDIAKEQFDKFMRTGIPPRGTVVVSWQTKFKTELIPEASLELLDRELYVGDLVKRDARDSTSGEVGSLLSCSILGSGQSGLNFADFLLGHWQEIDLHLIPRNEIRH